MSKITEFLKEEMLPYYNKEENRFKPYIQELYLTKEGWVDKAYIMRLTKQHMSVKSFRKAVKDVFGVASFEMTDMDSTVSIEEFLDVYEFGKHPFGRGWIKEIYEKTGKVISREQVYNYIMLTSPSRNSGSFAGSIPDHRGL